MSSIRIVHAQRAHAESYNRAVCKVAAERIHLASTEGFTLDETKAFLEMVLTLQAPQFLAVDESKNVVGWCDIVPRPYEGMRHVGQLGMGVVKEYRRRGIGKKLLEMALAAAATRGMEKVELEVFGSNEAAITLYESAGFVREGTRTNARKLDGVYDDILVMGLFLQQSG